MLGICSNFSWRLNTQLVTLHTNGPERGVLEFKRYNIIKNTPHVPEQDRWKESDEDDLSIHLHIMIVWMNVPYMAQE